MLEQTSKGNDRPLFRKTTPSTSHRQSVATTTQDLAPSETSSMNREVGYDISTKCHIELIYARRMEYPWEGGEFRPGRRPSCGFMNMSRRRLRPHTIYECPFVQLSRPFIPSIDMGCQISERDHVSGKILALDHETSAFVRWPCLKEILPLYEFLRSFSRNMRCCQKCMA